MQPRRIFISVAETSADLHAAALVRAAQASHPEWEFYGLTGPRLRALHVTTIDDLVAHAGMLGGAVGLVRRAWQVMRTVVQSWTARRPDLVVLLDSPEIHLRLAEKARRLGIPVLYYIAPQTWASRAGRNARIRRDVDRLACILPFEEQYFRAAGVNAEYVGHPLFESLRHEKPIPHTVDFLRERAGDRPLIAILPGSRRHVIDAVLPKQLEVVRRLDALGTPAHAAVSCVSEERREQIREHLRRSGLGATLEAGAHAPGARAGTDEPQLDKPELQAPGKFGREGGDHSLPIAGRSASAGAVDMVIDDNASLLSAADLVLVASGTATLLTAYYRKPMIVMYDAGWMLSLPYRLLGKYVVKTPHLSLVNVLAEARVVPEFMPFIADTAPIAAVAEQLLTDAAWRKTMTKRLDALVKPLEQSDASARVVRMMEKMLS